VWRLCKEEEEAVIICAARNCPVLRFFQLPPPRMQAVKKVADLTHSLEIQMAMYVRTCTVHAAKQHKPRARNPL